MTTDPASDAGLLRGAGASGVCFAAVFDRHHVRVFRHALVLVGSAHDADEVMAGAFFELWRRRESVTFVEGSALPWLLATATNLSRNLRRGLRRYQSLLSQLPRLEVPDPADIAASRLDARSREAAVRRAIRRLGPVDAALVSMTVFEEVSVSAAAAVLGLQAGAARTRLYRARKKLKTLLSELDPAHSLRLEATDNT